MSHFAIWVSLEPALRQIGNLRLQNHRSIARSTLVFENNSLPRQQAAHTSHAQVAYSADPFCLQDKTSLKAVEYLWENAVKRNKPKHFYMTCKTANAEDELLPDLDAIGKRAMRSEREARGKHAAKRRPDDDREERSAVWHGHVECNVNLSKKQAGRYNGKGRRMERDSEEMCGSLPRSHNYEVPTAGRILAGNRPSLCSSTHLATMESQTSSEFLHLWRWRDLDGISSRAYVAVEKSERSSHLAARRIWIHQPALSRIAISNWRSIHKSSLTPALIDKRTGAKEMDAAGILSTFRKGTQLPALSIDWNATFAGNTKTTWPADPRLHTPFSKGSTSDFSPS